ncbi:MAG: type II secretion system protein [Candidatus Omnitrophota bacterium]
MFKKKGFTIIELLIVIAVIGILVGIALPRFRGMQDEGNIAKAKAELKTLQTAIESYYSHNSNVYPTALANMTTATPQIIAVVPNDPFNGTTAYGYNHTGNYYAIYSVGPANDGTATVDSDGAITETDGASCIYVTNGTSIDAQP